MITKDQLQAMSDTQINKTLTELLGNKVEQHSIVNIGLQWCIVADNGALHRIPGYCNTPNDIMPLAFECRISIEYCHYGRYWAASAWKQTGKNEDTMIESFSEKEHPLRAIACCLILVLQEKQK